MRAFLALGFLPDPCLLLDFMSRLSMGRLSLLDSILASSTSLLPKSPTENGEDLRRATQWGDPRS